MALTISVATPKGGAGKTTIACLLAGEFSHRGHRVALLEGDDQGSAALWYETSVLRGRRPPNIDLVRAHTEALLRETLPRLDAEYDYIIIDAAGVADNRLSYAALAADLVVIPSRPHILDATQAVRMTKFLSAAALTVGVEPPPMKIVLNAVEAVQRNSQQMAEVVSYFSETGIPPIPVTLFNRVTYGTMMLGNGTLYQLPETDAVKNGRKNIADLLDRYLLV